MINDSLKHVRKKSRENCVNRGKNVEGKRWDSWLIVTKLKPSDFWHSS